MKTYIFTCLIVLLVMFETSSTQAVRAADEPVDPGITIYILPPITNEKILPTSSISSAYVSDEISITACPGEYEPASFVIQALDEIVSLEIEATDLVGEGASIPSSSIDIHVVKCWYQAGDRYNEPEHDKSAKVLTPELLLKDDSLVKVEDGENYIKLTTGEYKWISEVKNSQTQRSIPINELPIQDSNSLLPIDIQAGRNKQFWITVKIPNGTTPGLYSGSIELNTPSGSLGRVELNLEVLPITLLKSSIVQSIYYRGMLDGRYPDGAISPDFKSEQQFRAEMENLFAHGIINPTIYHRDWGIGWDEQEASPPRKPTLLSRTLAIRDDVGMDNDTIYLGGAINPWYGLPFNVEDYKDALTFFQNHGITDVYFYGKDEVLWSNGVPAQEAIDMLTAQRPAWEAIRLAGGKIFVAGVRAGYYSDVRSPGEFGFMGDILDLLICYGEPNAEEAARWHSIGHKIYCYGNPHVGEEKPETYRRNYGLLLWQKDYDGAMNYAYQDVYGESIWNDFDHAIYRDHIFTYPTINGVIDTIQWEGWREGVDDTRYLTTLLKVIEEEKANGKDTSSAEAWLADLKISNLNGKDLDAVRSQMINYILSLSSINQPPVFNPIGDKSVAEGDLLSFVILATDPDSDNLTYSAFNLPEGASFDPQTRTFSWTPAEVGTYYNIRFEVSDGNLTHSTNITINVLSFSPPSSPPSPPSGGSSGPAPPSTISGGNVRPALPGYTYISPDMIRSDGILTSHFIAKSEDDRCMLIIDEGTRALNEDREALDRITIIETEEIPPPPDGSDFIGLVYDFGPNGAIFDPAITIKFNYEASMITQAVPEEKLVIALWDEKAEAWIVLENCLVDPVTNTITALTDHFTTFAMLGYEVVSPATFELSSLSISPDDVEIGEEIIISTIVTNTGGEAGNHKVTLKIDGVVEAIKEVTVDPGAAQEVSFGTVKDAAGTYVVDVNGAISAFVVREVVSPATFELSSLSISPDDIEIGEEIIISTIVTNTGGEAGNHKITLKIDSVVEAIKEVTLDPGATQEVSFSTVKDAAGTYAVDVNDAISTFVVKEATPAEISNFSVTPNYLNGTHQPTFTRVVCEVTNLYKQSNNIELTLRVSLDGEPLGEVPLIPSAKQAGDGIVASQDYIPPEGWESGTYSFGAELFVGGKLCATTLEEELEVIAPRDTQLFSLAALGQIVSAALLLIVVAVSAILLRRRQLLRRLHHGIIETTAELVEITGHEKENNGVTDHGDTVGQLIEKEVKNVIVEEMRKAIKEVLQEQSKAIRFVVEEHRRTIMDTAEEVAKTIRQDKSRRRID